MILRHVGIFFTGRRLILPTSRLPLDIKELLTEHFDSVVQLEVLFLFFENPFQTLSAAEIAKQLRNSSTVVKKILERLEKQGFLSQQAPEIYELTKSEEQKEKIAKVYNAYKERPVAIIAFLYEKPNNTIKGFADAFKIKKD